MYALMFGLTDLADPRLDETTIQKVAASFGDSLATMLNTFGGETLGQTITPTVLDPALDIALNTRWSGGPITPEWVKRGGKTVRADLLPAYEQYWEDTPSTLSGRIAMAVSKPTEGALKFLGSEDAPTPEQIRYVGSAIFGGPARFATQTMNTLNTAIKGGEIDPNQIPILSSFLRSSTPERAAAIKERRSGGTEDARMELERQAVETIRTGEAVAAAHKELLSLPPGEQRTTMWNALRANNPALVEDIIEYHEKVELAATRNERMLRELSVEGGYRSRSVYRQLIAMEPAERRNTYLRWREAGIITSNVARDLELIAANPQVSAAVIEQGKQKP
jgi:hypothetical protein